MMRVSAEYMLGGSLDTKRMFLGVALHIKNSLFENFLPNNKLPGYFRVK